MAHWEGDDWCGPDCNGPHHDDAYPHSECCPTCGGNGRGCRFGCVEARRGAYEPYEGRTGAQEMYAGGEG